MNTNTIQVGTVSSRADVEKLLLAMEAQALLDAGAHVRVERFDEEVLHGRAALAGIARRELKTQVQATIRVSAVRR